MSTILTVHLNNNLTDEGVDSVVDAIEQNKHVLGIEVGEVNVLDVSSAKMSLRHEIWMDLHTVLDVYLGTFIRSDEVGRALRQKLRDALSGYRARDT